MVTLVLGNQLFSDYYRQGPCLMIEDLGIASRFRYHRLRLLHQFVSMREFRDELVESGIQVEYFTLSESIGFTFFQRVEKVLQKYNSSSLTVADIPDARFKGDLIAWAKNNKITLSFTASPQFLVSEDYFHGYLRRYQKPFMKHFYENVRKDYQILVEKDLSPVGGKWSFDAENRKKLPKSVHFPKFPEFQNSRHFNDVRELINVHFRNHPGDLPKDELWLPTCRNESLRLLQHFLDHTFDRFGPYEDAIDQRDDFLFHSALSPLMNIGFIGPGEVIHSAIQHAKKNNIAIESLEGFVRQILGWREFIRGVHHNFHTQESKGNFFQHERKMKPCWYEGTTGLPPVDDAIRKTVKLAYNHHIERLMVLSNVMLLTELSPTEVHRWFMEMYIDSYEWVMGPNVYGMGQFSDGGIFATKPYISGSNYILKMSTYPKGEWCEIWDGLYWSFIQRHSSFFVKNPRLSMMNAMLTKMEPKKKERLLSLAENFKNRTSHHGLN